MSAGQARRRVEILAMLDQADASLVKGEGIVITEQSMKELAEDVKARGPGTSCRESVA